MNTRPYVELLAQTEPMNAHMSLDKELLILGIQPGKRSHEAVWHQGLRSASLPSRTAPERSGESLQNPSR